MSRVFTPPQPFSPEFVAECREEIERAARRLNPEPEAERVPELEIVRRGARR